MNARPMTPLYRHSLREAAVILSTWLVCSLWSCTYCYLYGYSVHEPDNGAVGMPVSQITGPLTSWNRTADSLQMPGGWGIPDWAWYGVFLPWIACVLFTFWFCLMYFKIDDLGADVGQSGSSTGRSGGDGR